MHLRSLRTTARRDLLVVRCGMRTPLSLLNAVTFLFLASSLGFADYQAGLKSYEAKNYANAFSEWLPVAAQGDAKAQYRIGLLFATGRGVDKDYTEAAKWYRKAAEQGFALAQNNLGVLYHYGRGVSQDDVEATKWYREAAIRGLAVAQNNLGYRYLRGGGVPQNYVFAEVWFALAGPAASKQDEAARAEVAGHLTSEEMADALRRADQWRAEISVRQQSNVTSVPTGLRDLSLADWLRLAKQGNPAAQDHLGLMYHQGNGVKRDFREAARWFRLAADQGNTDAQTSLGVMYQDGEGLPKDHVQAHMWYNLASAGGDLSAQQFRDSIEAVMTPAEIANAQRLARAWKPHVDASPSAPPGAATTGTIPSEPPGTVSADSLEALLDSVPDVRLEWTGTGFFVSTRGHLLTNSHVVEGCGILKLRDGLILDVVAQDGGSDLALLKSGESPARVLTFSVAPGRVGQPVVAAGYPLPGVLSSGLNVTSGNISALAGPRDNTTLLQMTAPVQPGNSGGPLLDESGSVIGIVVAKLDALKMAQVTGDIPQNVNFAVKGEVAQTFLKTHGVQPKTAPSGGMKLDPTIIADNAMKSTVVVECWK